MRTTAANHDPSPSRTSAQHSKTDNPPIEGRLAHEPPLFHARKEPCMYQPIRARSIPYRPLAHTERVCERCGITYTLNHTTRDRHIVRCRDCRGMR